MSGPSIIDSITGGSILPHVWCKKITLERRDTTNVYKQTEFGLEVDKVLGNNMTKVTLQLEIYQEKASLYKSNWLNDFSVDGSSLIDSIFIQIMPFKNYNNVIKLLPGNSPLKKSTSSNSEGNVYTAKRFYEDNFLPRGSAGMTGAAIPNKIFSFESAPPPPLQFSKASPIGDLSNGASSIEDAFRKGKIKEEIINGKAYFVLPYEYSYDYYEEPHNLGFLFYSFLHFPRWFEGLQMDIDPSLWSQYFEELIVEGPINSEIVFLNGDIVQQRQAFFLPDGQPWGGSVHLHGPDNPDPSGYYGDGGFSPDGTFRGWMAGEKHVASAAQQKLSLQQVPNNLISDFRRGLFPEPIDNALGKMDQDIPELNKGITKIEEFLSPLQKEKRKDFIKDDDSEFSKLYVSRDSAGSCSGVFYIDTLELLKNNSSLFPLLFDESPPGADGFLALLLENPLDVLSILENCKLLELKVYRDRVKENVINTRYEKYQNDEMYEEPSKLIGSISDGGTFKSVVSSASLSEVKSLQAVDDEGNDLFSQFKNRYFVFKDAEMANITAGTYMYRLEMKFKDGTYEFLYKLFQSLSRTKILLETYYDMSVSSYTNSTTSRTFQYSRQQSDSEQYSKAVFTRFFKNGSFKNPEFFEFADSYFSDPSKNPSGAKPWKSAVAVLTKFQRIFGLFPGKGSSKLQFTDPSLYNLLDPVTGSPQGISFFISLFETAINKVQSLLSATKVNRTGSEIDTNSVPNGYTYNNLFDIVVSPSDSTIHEEYTFDHPNELFTAVDNKLVFLDYLSVGSAALSPLYAARVVSNEYFMTRCRLEAAKWSPLAKTDQGFSGLGIANNIGLVTTTAENQIDLQIFQDDSLERNAYSFLAPSVISVKTNIEVQDPGYDQTIRCFQPYNIASGYLNSDLQTSVLLRQEFFNFAKQDKMFIDVVNYFQDKKSNKNLTFSSPKMHIQSVNLSGPVNAAMSWRDSYKNILEDLGVTFHNKSKHDEIYGASPVLAENPGAGTNIDTKNLDEIFPLSPTDFTDGLSFPLEKFKNLLYSSYQNIVRMNYSKAIPEGYSAYNINYPNAFKYPHILASRKAHPGHGANELLHSKIQNYISEKVQDISSFIYFQVNLVAKIEVFVGSSGTNAKNDETAWRTLRKQDLLMPDGSLQFCKISLYDKNLAQGMELPILDQYFFITSNQLAEVEQPLPEPQTFPDINDEVDLGTGINFWESKNYLKIAEMNTMVQKGLLQGPNMQIMPADIGTQIQKFSAIPEPGQSSPPSNLGGLAAQNAAAAQAGTGQQVGSSPLAELGGTNVETANPAQGLGGQFNTGPSDGPIGGSGY